MNLNHSILIIALVSRWTTCDSFRLSIKHSAIKSTKNLNSLHSIHIDTNDCVGCTDDMTTATKLRNVQLSDSKGTSFTLGSKIGNDKSIVIFLRHLA